jgi:hypothetical protein
MWAYGVVSPASQHPGEGVVRDITGNNGTDGFNFGAAWNFTQHTQIAADYDTTWDDTILGTFQLTPVGTVTSKSHLQNWLFGPRVFFYSGDFHKRRFNVFGEAQFGFSHLKSKLEMVALPTVSTASSRPWADAAAGSASHQSSRAGSIRVR